ncbi:hypothetical protein BC567DRAFT_9224 [Phyllosticta citribraziliensis]
MTAHETSASMPWTSQIKTNQVKPSQDKTRAQREKGGERAQAAPRVSIEKKANIRTSTARTTTKYATAPTVTRRRKGVVWKDVKGVGEEVTGLWCALKCVGPSKSAAREYRTELAGEEGCSRIRVHAANRCVCQIHLPWNICLPWGNPPTRVT